MTKRSDALVIVPVHNEAASLGSVLAELRMHAPDCDALVVNDGSTDTSPEVAHAAGVQVLDLCFNVGIGGAMQAGFKYALERDYLIAVQLDGDGQHLAEEIPSLIEPVRSGALPAVRSRNQYTDSPAASSRLTAMNASFCRWLTRYPRTFSPATSPRGTSGSLVTLTNGPSNASRTRSKATPIWNASVHPDES